MRDITCPANPEQILVWRYMNTDKFVDLIQKERLYLTHASYFEDKLEGLPTNMELKEWHVEDMHAGSHSNKEYWLSKNQFYISGWHKNNYDSYAMWRLYAGRYEGVAIQTTYHDLLNCALTPHNDLIIGAVNYVDFYSDHHDAECLSNNEVERYMRKDLSFQYENEVRIIKVLPQSKVPVARVYIEVAIEKLIRKIYVNPYAPSWYYKTIKFLIAEYATRKSQQLLLNRLQPSKEFIKTDRQLEVI